MAAVEPLTFWSEPTGCTRSPVGWSSVRRSRSCDFGGYLAISAGRVPRLLAELEQAQDLYSISQVVMDAWTSGRVALVGDSGYSPGAAVDGCSLAIIGAYTPSPANQSGPAAITFGASPHTSRPSNPSSGTAGAGDRRRIP